MPSIAAGLVDFYFQQHFKRGAIIRFYMECDNPNQTHRNKFGIVLNKDVTDDETLLAITTTKQDYFAGGYFENDILRIPANSYSCFGKETIVNLREVRAEPILKLKGLCVSGQLEFRGQVTPADMEVIDQIVRDSKLIEGRYKKRIV